MFFDQGSVFCYMTSQGETYRRVLPDLDCLAKESFECLLLSLDEEETSKILGTCEACVQVKKPFNLSDILLLYVPFREVEDLPIDKAPTLNNAQAIILILRECLRLDNPLRQAIEGLNSRQTLLEDLFRQLQPFCVAITTANMRALSSSGSGSVDERQGNPFRQH